MKRHPEPANISGEKPIVYNMLQPYLCGEKQREGKWASVSSENGEQ